MQDTFLKLWIKGKLIVESLKDESGQDLVEYGLVIALIVLGATAGMTTLATGINSAMSTVSNKIGAKLT